VTANNMRVVVGVTMAGRTITMPLLLCDGVGVVTEVERDLRKVELRTTVEEEIREKLDAEKLPIGILVSRPLSKCIGATGVAVWEKSDVSTFCVEVGINIGRFAGATRPFTAVLKRKRNIDGCIVRRQ